MKWITQNQASACLLGLALLAGCGVGLALWTRLPSVQPNVRSFLTGDAAPCFWEPVAQADSSGPPAANTAQVLNVNRIRVGISDDAMTAQEYPEAIVSANGPFVVLDQATQQPVWQGQAWQQVQVTRNRNGFWLMPRHGTQANQTLGSFQGPLRLLPQGPNTFLRLPAITRKGNIPSYRGELSVEVAYSAPNKLAVVNTLDLNDYLRAVVPNELPMRFGKEAVKAQAVAARNYALRPRTKPWPQFDICDSQFCQAYYGQQTETPGTDAALAETEGLLALYRGEPILALYSSSHGGHSEAYENVFADPQTGRFPGQPLPYLQARPDQPEGAGLYGNLAQESNAQRFYSEKPASFDQLSSLYRWQRQWSWSSLQTELQQALRTLSADPLTRNAIDPPLGPTEPLGRLNDLAITRRGYSGKAMTLTLWTDRGVWTVQKEFTIRKVLAHQGKMLPSANIVLRRLTDTAGQPVGLTVLGGGFGHGVGMSQYGASYLSEQLHWPFERILQQYYTGIAIGTIPLHGHTQQSELTRFYGLRATGQLHLKTPGGLLHPVQLLLNGRRYEIEASPHPHVCAHLQGIAVQQSNTLQLLPHPQGEQLRLWLELVPAAPSSSGP